MLVDKSKDLIRKLETLGYCVMSQSFPKNSYDHIMKNYFNTRMNMSNVDLVKIFK